MRLGAVKAAPPSPLLSSYRFCGHGALSFVLASEILDAFLFLAT